MMVHPDQILSARGRARLARGRLHPMEVLGDPPVAAARLHGERDWFPLEAVTRRMVERSSPWVTSWYVELTTGSACQRVKYVVITYLM